MRRSPEVRNYGYELWGCEVFLRFPVAKLLDYANRLEELEASANPFAHVVLAHLKTQETRHDPSMRRTWKLRLVKNLYGRGFGPDDVRRLFRVIDWFMDLPKTLENEFWQDYQQFEQEKHMPYITSVERIGIEKGMEKGTRTGLRAGLLKGIAFALEMKFGNGGLKVLEEIQAIDDPEVLEGVLQAVRAASSPDELRKSCLPGNIPAPNNAR